MNAIDAKNKTQQKRIEIINSDSDLKKELTDLLNAIQENANKGFSFLYYKEFVDERIIQHIIHDLGYKVNTDLYPEIQVSWS